MGRNVYFQPYSGGGGEDMYGFDNQVRQPRLENITDLKH